MPKNDRAAISPDNPGLQNGRNLPGKPDTLAIHGGASLSGGRAMQ